MHKTGLSRVCVLVRAVGAVCFTLQVFSFFTCFSVFYFWLSVFRHRSASPSSSPEILTFMFRICVCHYTSSRLLLSTVCFRCRCARLILSPWFLSLACLLLLPFSFLTLYGAIVGLQATFAHIDHEVSSNP